VNNTELQAEEIVRANKTAAPVSEIILRVQEVRDLIRFIEYYRTLEQRLEAQLGANVKIIIEDAKHCLLPKELTAESLAKTLKSALEQAQLDPISIGLVLIQQFPKTADPMKDKINQIKKLRELTGSTLADAKAAIEKAREMLTQREVQEALTPKPFDPFSL
jgi:ribosomal protein L7/L12